MTTSRSGLGFDLHPLVDGRQLFRVSFSDQ
jgi:hypothetical protein